MNTTTVRQLRHDFGNRVLPGNLVADERDGGGGEVMKPGVPKKPTRRTQKNAPAKESWQALRERYTWHLRPPFKDQFDRTHWWKGKQAAKQRVTPQPPFVFGKSAPGTAEKNGDSTLDPVAALCELRRRTRISIHIADSTLDPVSALYELARRHPVIGELRLNMNGESARKFMEDAPDEIHCLLKVGLKSWPKLTRNEQMSWQLSVGNQRGVDCRPESEQCYSISAEARHSITFAQVFGALKQQAPTVEDKEQSVASCAVEAHRKGYRLFALAPDLSADKAASLLSRQYESHSLLGLRPMKKERARCESWLGVIADFEKVATDRKQTAKSPVFTLYRRAVDGPAPSSPRFRLRG